MERYAKGQINLWDLVNTYEWEFDTAVPEEFPSTKFCPKMKELYYNQGLEYLKNFPGYADKKILEVEAVFEHDIDDWVFNGIIDLVFEDEEGRLIIVHLRAKKNRQNTQDNYTSTPSISRTSMVDTPMRCAL